MYALVTVVIRVCDKQIVLNTVCSRQLYVPCRCRHLPLRQRDGRKFLPMHLRT